MRIVDAVWEKRNLGVSTQEVTIDPEDENDLIIDGIRSLDADYQVVKIPTGKVETMWKLHDMGFKYIETAIHVTHDLKNILMSPLQKRVDGVVSYDKMNEEDITQLYDEFQKGLFNTDRIIMDPFFSRELAGRRYIGWIEDERKKGSELYKIVYKDKAVGFFSYKHVGDGIYYPFLASIYKDYQDRPFGMVYLYKPIYETIRRCGKMVSTYISTNNRNAVRLHVEAGFQFREVSNVLVKHRKDNE